MSVAAHEWQISARQGVIETLETISAQYKNLGSYNMTWFVCLEAGAITIHEDLEC